MTQLPPSVTSAAGAGCARVSAPSTLVAPDATGFVGSVPEYATSSRPTLLRASSERFTDWPGSPAPAIFCQAWVTTPPVVMGVGKTFVQPVTPVGSGMVVEPATLA